MSMILRFPLQRGDSVRWGRSSLSARGVPIDVAGQVGSYVYFGALIGSGFRPGLLTQLPRRDEERGWLHYGNLYFLTGWTGVAYVGVWGVFPLLEPYL